jgi:membrane protein YdbS with pleckstrin-like domain
MAQQKKKHHPGHPPVPKIKKEIKRWRVILVAIIFFVLFGAGIAWFAAGNNATWLFVGAAIGALLGYFFGRQIVHGLFKTKDLAD